MTRPPVFGVVGWKNSGKTTLVVRLVAELTGRGYRVSTLKHAHHAFDVDQEGTDSFRHRQAGASEVALVSGRRWALMHELRDDSEPSMTNMLDRLSPCDIVLVEGYKRESHPKIEVRRSDSVTGDWLAPNDPQIVAIASDHATDSGGLPRFDLDDVGQIADFAVAYLGLGKT